MAIQRLNLGTAPTGVGGDTERSAFKKIDDNFGDSNNACSRTVGNQNGQLPSIDAKNGLTIKNVLQNASWQFRAETQGVTQGEISGFTMYSTFYGTQDNGTRRCADITAGFTGVWGSEFLSLRVGKAGQANDAGALSDERVLITADNITFKNKVFAIGVYNATTAISPNVAVADNGQILRSTSSERYKKDIQHIELSDKDYQAIRQVKPITYKSTATSDNPNWIYQSFSAEELGKASPTLVLWEYEETVIDEGTGLQVTRKLPSRRPAGLNLNGIIALQHAVSLKQADLIDKLTKQNKELAERVTALENKGA